MSRRRNYNLEYDGWAFMTPIEFEKKYIMCFDFSSLVKYKIYLSELMKCKIYDWVSKAHREALKMIANDIHETSFEPFHEEGLYCTLDLSIFADWADDAPNSTNVFLHVSISLNDMSDKIEYDFNCVDIETIKELYKPKEIKANDRISQK